MSEPHYKLAQQLVTRLLLVSAVILSPLQASTGIFTKNQTDTEQVLRVGQLFSLVIGEPQEMPELISLAIRDLPEGAMLLHNRDGTLSFMWVPQADDIGNLQLDIVSQTTDQLYGTLNLLVADAERYEQLRQQQLFQATPPTPIPAPPPDSSSAEEPDTEVTDISQSDEKLSSTADTDNREVTPPVVNTSTVVKRVDSVEEQSIADTPTAAAPAEPAATDTTPDGDRNAPPSNTVLAATTTMAEARLAPAVDQVDDQSDNLADNEAPPISDGLADLADVSDDESETDGLQIAFEPKDALAVLPPLPAIDTEEVAASIMDEPTIETAATSPDQSTPIVAEAVSSAPSADQVAESPTAPAEAEMSTTTLEVDSDLLLPAGVKAVVPIKLHTNRENATLRILNLPKSASLKHRGTKLGPGTRDGLRTDNYALVWTPPQDRSVMHVVVLQVRVDGRVVTSRRLQLVTVL